MFESMFLETIIQNLLAERRSYGILEVSMEQYRVVCNEFLRFSITKGVNTYSDQIMADYLEAVIARCGRGEICPEYLRIEKGPYECSRRSPLLGVLIFPGHY